ncbi:hypothetical protein EXIGLDRAFT_843090 [Exidia glandulosa HHB12029]|uniref:Uncharacterized protein n=1 Tax=Exidia glandulosa HHB12029 TaxID=1314781 RepID=A0A165CWH0_EXIGL|nr:hypothetical protein EXIGLDRAFT_843090 [Exidia glandulosa HHB12029]
MLADLRLVCRSLSGRWRCCRGRAHPRRKDRWYRSWPRSAARCVVSSPRRSHVAASQERLHAMQCTRKAAENISSVVGTMGVVACGGLHLSLRGCKYGHVHLEEPANDLKNIGGVNGCKNRSRTTQRPRSTMRYGDGKQSPLRVAQYPDSTLVQLFHSDACHPQSISWISDRECKLGTSSPRRLADDWA